MAERFIHETRTGAKKILIEEDLIIGRMFAQRDWIVRCSGQATNEHMESLYSRGDLDWVLWTRTRFDGDTFVWINHKEPMTQQQAEDLTFGDRRIPAGEARELVL